MDEVTRSIFRSWIWPNERFNTFSSRPTPYNISKHNYINPASVYKAWHNLIDTGYIKKLVMMPSDAIASRQLLLIPGDSIKISEVFNRLSGIYFIESMHLGHVYESSGIFSMNASWLVILEIINSPFKLLDKNIRIINDMLNGKFNIIKATSFDYNFKMPENLNELYNYFAYKNIYDINLKNISEKFKKSLKTINRWTNYMLQNGYFYLTPIIDQKMLSKGFLQNIFVVSLKLDDNKNLQNILNSMPMASQRYLLLRNIGDISVILFYYENIDELDECMFEISKKFRDFAVITRFTSNFNSDLL